MGVSVNAAKMSKADFRDVDFDIVNLSKLVEQNG
jgi:hypothetical protein